MSEDAIQRRYISFHVSYKCSYNCSYDIIKRLIPIESQTRGQQKERDRRLTQREDFILVEDRSATNRCHNSLTYVVFCCYL